MLRDYNIKVFLFFLILFFLSLGFIVLSRLTMIPDGLWIVGIVGCMLGSIILFLFYFNEVYQKTDEIVRQVLRVRTREKLKEAEGLTDLERIHSHISTYEELLEQTTLQLKNIEAPVKTSDFIGFETHSVVGAIRDLKRKLVREKEDNKKTKWYDDGIRVMAEASQKNRENLRTFSQHFLSILLGHIERPVGAVYLYSEFDPDAPLKVFAAYGFAQTEIHDSVNIDDTLIGRSIRELKTLHLRQIPEDYQQVKSGTGQAHATEVLIIPLIANELAVGALEIASFIPMDDTVLEFCEQISTLFAVNLNNIHLSEYSIQRYNDVLSDNRRIQSQFLDLETELNETKELLNAVSQERDLLYTRLDKHQSSYELFRKFLDGTPQRILFKDEESHILEASRKVLQSAKFTDPEEIYGMSDLDLYDPETVKKLLREERIILRGSQPILNEFQQLNLKNGTTLNVLSNTFGIQDEAGEVVGTIVTQNELPDYIIDSRELLIEGFVKLDAQRNIVDSNAPAPFSFPVGSKIAESLTADVLQLINSEPRGAFKLDRYEGQLCFTRNEKQVIIYFVNEQTYAK